MRCYLENCFSLMSLLNKKRKDYPDTDMTLAQFNITVPNLKLRKKETILLNAEAKYKIMFFPAVNTFQKSASNNCDVSFCTLNHP